ncbi:MAG: Asd/ArgC dimerization domain-containing protein [Butyricicoccaceae bacterium]
MVDNVIPYIGGEEEEREGADEDLGPHRGRPHRAATTPVISAQSRVACSDGHMAAASVKFKNKPSGSYDRALEQLRDAHEAEPAVRSGALPYFEDNRPQTADRNLENGMGVSIGRLREDTIFDYKFVSLSHNTLRGAAGGAVLMAELLCAEGYMDR